MRLAYSALSASLLTLGLLACSPAEHSSTSLPATAPAAPAAASPLQIAFLPDVHFHDIYSDFSGTDFPGPVNSHSAKQATIRTMSTQLKSTRLFNENYFALLAALDDLAKRNVKFVVLPGDYSDDGQPAHVQGLQRILSRYQQQHGMQFFITNGNHDPVKPVSRPAGKPDYLHANGTPQAVYSPEHPACQGDNAKYTTCTPLVQEWGYQEQWQTLADFAFYPQRDYLYWETPYSQYNTKNYQFEQALTAADFAKRQYEICLQGTGDKYRQATYTHCKKIADSSYLVEPVAGLWLLAVDANVYVPDAAQPEEATDAAAFNGSGNAGYNVMLSHKQHVIEWISDVTARAADEGKHLITFSHYPMTEFYQGQAKPLAALFGESKFQLSRSPTEHTAKTMAATGVQVHIGGHMHLNNTSTVLLPDGRYLVNIQAPSLAAYVPAYKLLTLHPTETEVETIVLEQIPRFTELFEHYEKEYQALTANGATAPWDHSILQSASYREFTAHHLAELTKQRFLPSDWPASLRQIILEVNGLQLLTLAQLPAEIPLTAITQFEQLQSTDAWQQATKQAIALADAANIPTDALVQWQGMELAVDFYKLRNAGQLALADMTPARLAQYRWLTGQFNAQRQPNTMAHTSLAAVVNQQFGALFGMMTAFSHGTPDQHFLIDNASGRITDLSQTSAAISKKHTD